MRIKNLLFLLPLFITFSGASQVNYNEEWITPVIEPVSFSDSVKKKDCEQKDLGDVFRSIFAKNKEKKERAPKKFSFLILPNISSNPANGFLLGVGGNLAWYLGPRETTRISLIGFSAAVTSKQQFPSFVKSSVYTKENKFFLQGDWRFYQYKLPTYGLGIRVMVNKYTRINLNLDFGIGIKSKGFYFSGTETF